MMKTFIRVSRSQKGMSLILLVLMISVLIVLTAVLLSGMRDKHSQMNSRTRLLLAGTTIMRSFGVVVQRAYDVYQLNGSLCPAGTVQITPANSTANFCFASPITTVCMDGYCLEGIPVADQQTHEIVFDARLETTIGDRLLAWLKPKGSFVNLSSTAFAQRVVGTPPPANPADTNNSISVITCPGDPLCKACDGVSLHCITLRICPIPAIVRLCNPNEYWVQRYGVRAS